MPRLFALALAVCVLAGCAPRSDTSSLQRYDDPVVLSIDLQRDAIKAESKAHPNYQSKSQAVIACTGLILIDVGLAALHSPIVLDPRLTCEVQLIKLDAKGEPTATYRITWGKNFFVDERTGLDGNWVIAFSSPRLQAKSKPFRIDPQHYPEAYRVDLIEGLETH